MTKNQMKEFNIYLFLYSKLMIYNKVLSGLFNITLLIILVKSFQLKKKREHSQLDTKAYSSKLLFNQCSTINIRIINNDEHTWLYSKKKNILGKEKCLQD